MEKLPGDYIAGLVDGEGCFYTNFRRDVRHERKNAPVYFYWNIGFAVVLRSDDREILEAIQKTLDCGRISLSRAGTAARYEVTDIKDLTLRVVPFFEQHPLRAKKRFDFELWREALSILMRNQQRKMARNPGQVGFLKIAWRPIDISRLKRICEEMKPFKSKGADWKWINTKQQVT